MVPVETLPVIGAAVALCLAALWHDAAVSTLPLAARLSALVLSGPVRLRGDAHAPGDDRRFAGRFALRGAPGGARRDGRPGGRVRAVEHSAAGRTYSPGATLLDPLWVVGLVVIGVGGVIAARAPEEVAELDEPAKRGGVLPAADVRPAARRRWSGPISSDAPRDPAVILGAGLLLSGGALIMRRSLLERRLREMLERERATLASLADREEELARNERAAARGLAS